MVYIQVHDQREKSSRGLGCFAKNASYNPGVMEVHISGIILELRF